MEVWRKFYSVENSQLSSYTSTAAFMRYRALPMALRDRIYLFMDFKYQGNFYKESILKKMLSFALRQEILFTISEEGMGNVRLFKKCPDEALNKIRRCLVSQIFLPGDVIIKEGTEGNCMFFILAGTVAVTAANKKTLCYLKDGAHFGEIALVINIPRVANVVAITPCELFRLEKTHFTNVMRLYPKILRQIRNDANERIAKTSESLLDADKLFKTSIRRKRVFYCFNE
ncbi:unnamed protein product [Ceutorhynchus assimilis]|uniref:Cyclic nucleotide-binding domain-containing protein n=1 Tax=Ceutorhynchus assimilis TaxID=467358 RepID=A0A9P0DLM9_9CUCU|nr:unnamed protein product [Ceutorhynchus assimilis]